MIYWLKDRFARYHLEYDVKDKMLFIRKDIPVKEFMRIKTYIKVLKIELNDIRVTGGE